MVVMMCLGGLAVILTISGSIAAAIQNRAKAKPPLPWPRLPPPRCGGQTGHDAGNARPSSPQRWTPP